MNFKKLISILIILAAALYAGYHLGRSSHPGKSPGTMMGTEGTGPESAGKKERKVKYWQAPMDPTYIRDKPGKSPMGMDLIPVYEDEEEPQPKKERKIKYWQAPMDPTYIRDKPGKSPMGMDLIPVYEDEGEESDSGVIKIDPVTVQNIGVKTAIVENRPLAREIRTVGRIDYNEQRVEHIHTKMEGWVEKLYVDFLGEEVSKGAPLLAIYSPELVSTQEEYLLALKYRNSLGASSFPAVSEGADTLLSSTRRRLELFDITPRQIDEIEKSGEVRKDLILHSPTHGVVIEKMVQEGMYVKPGMNLYTIADISDVWVYADIYEYELPWLKVGQEAEMTLSYLTGKTFRGKITYIYPFLDKKTRTVKVRMEFDNPGWELKPDMYTNVKVRSRIAGKTLAVPVEAVLRSGDRDVVIIALEEGKFLPRDIRLGAEGEGYYQVLDGLSEGDRIVTSAHFLIDSESKLQEAIAKMLAVQQKKGSANKQKNPPTTMDSMKMDGVINGTALSEPLRKQMDKIVESYLVLQKKLSTDTIEGAQPLAVTIATLTEKVKTEDTDHVLKSTTTALTAAAPELLSSDIKTVREGFKKLSSALTAYIKSADRQGAKEKGLKLFYCPMVKVEWMQTSDTVENPFFGSKMPTCGNKIEY